MQFQQPLAFLYIALTSRQILSMPRIYQTDFEASFFQDQLRRIARGVRQRELRVTTKCPPPAGCRTEPRYGGPRRLIRLERYQRHNASPAACTIGGSTSPRLWRSGYPGMGRRSSETAPTA